MGFNPPPGWQVPHGWNPPPDWVPDPSWPPAPPGWQFWTEDWTAGPEAEDAPQPAVRGPRPIALIAVIVLVVGAVLGGGYLLIDRLTGDDDGGGPVAGQLRGTFPGKPTVGWRLDGDTVFDRAEFVRPDPTSNQYQTPGFIDLDDTLVTSAILPQSDRGATLVAVDAESGQIRWTSDDVGFKPVCATATVDGLLPCVGKEAVFGADSGPRPKVSFIRMSDGAIDHQLEVSKYMRAVEVHGSAVYTTGFDHDKEARIITRGTVDDLDADWSRTYPSTSTESAGCPASGDTLFDGVEGDVVYTGSDGGLAVASVSDGDPLTQREMADLNVFGAQGFTARVCDPQDPSVVTTSVVDTEGNTLRTVADATIVADPWLVEPSAELPYIIGRTAYNFATGEELWTASGGALYLHTVVGDTVLGDLNDGQLAAFDLKTGEELWTSRHRGQSVELSDGQRIMVATDAGLVAVDLATGEDLWTLSGVKSWSLAPAGSGFAHAVNESITFYPPTGGPSVAPGRVGASSSSDADESGGLITKCGRTPEMQPMEYRAEDGSLFVKMEVKARCPSGDIISTDRLRVTIRDQSGLICAGLFDFSQNPLVIGGERSEPTTLELEFGPGTFSRHPNTLGEHSGQPTGSGEIITQSKASGTELVDCEDEGTSDGPQSAERASGKAEARSRPDQPGGPVSGCGSDEDALAALRTQVDSDRPFVQSQLVDRWVAQLSSKQPGLVAPDVDGRMVTWTPCEILQQHLRMRGQYPEVRLVWSDEWRTFDLAGWWVTVAGLTFPDGDAANGWCDARAIPVDECFAKVISNTNNSGRTTKYRR